MRFSSSRFVFPRVFSVLLPLVLAACVSKTQVPLALQSSFGPPPANNPEPLVKGPQAIAAPRSL